MISGAVSHDDPIYLLVTPHGFKKGRTYTLGAQVYRKLG